MSYQHNQQEVGSVRESDDLPGLTLSQDDILERNRRKTGLHHQPDEIHTKAPRSGISSGTFWVMCFFLISLVLGQGWYLYQLMTAQKSGSDGLQSEFSLTQNKIDELKAAMEQVTHNLTVQEGVLDEKLGKLAKEQGKLIAMSERGNISSLEALRGKSGQIETDMSIVKAELSKLSSLIDSMQSTKEKNQATVESLKNDIDQVTKKQALFKEFSTQLQAVSDEIKQVESASVMQKEEFDDLANKLAKLSAKPPEKAGIAPVSDNLKVQIDAQAQAIESINAFRRQVNQSLDQIYSELRRLDANKAR